MPRWVARPVLGLFCLLGMVLVIKAVPGAGAWLADATVVNAEAAVLSTGVFPDQGSQAPTDAPDASDTPAVAPFAGLRTPDAKLGNILTAPADPLVANVEGHPIYLSELGDAVQSLPEQLRKMPFEVIYPMLLDRMVDHEALVLLARHQKLDDDPKVKRQIDIVTARVLEGALLERTAVAQVTEPAIRARYQRDFGSQATVEEVHARHILVGTEDEAKRLITELDKGSDFAALARQFSKDPDGARGGDLGFFRHDQVWAGFADAAFALRPGEIAQTPISNEFGWHVVQTLERRRVAPPTLEQMHDALRKQLLQEAVQRVVALAREGLRVTKYNLDGSPMDNSAASAALGILPPDAGKTVQTGGQPAAAAPLAASPSTAAPPAHAPAPVHATPRAPQKTGN